MELIITNYTLLYVSLVVPFALFIWGMRLEYAILTKKKTIKKIVALVNNYPLVLRLFYKGFYFKNDFRATPVGRLYHKELGKVSYKRILAYLFTVVFGLCGVFRIWIDIIKTSEVQTEILGAIFVLSLSIFTLSIPLLKRIN